MRHMQSIFILVLLTIGWVCCPIHGQAADFPNKPMTLVVPYPAGGATDLVIRPLAEAAKKYLGQPVVVENRSGGGERLELGVSSEKIPMDISSPSLFPAFIGTRSSINSPSTR